MKYDNRDKTVTTFLQNYVDELKNKLPNNTGKLNFPNLLFEYCPEEGDLILFPSHGDEFIHGVDSITAERYTLAFWMTEDKNFILT